MYGYHPKQHTFIKIYLYNPFMVKRASDLLQHGAVMNKVLQPHESHCNLVLQFFMDYNLQVRPTTPPHTTFVFDVLQGMNEIHLACGKFRQGVVPLPDGLDEVESILSPPWLQNRPDRTELHTFTEEEDPAAAIAELTAVAPDQRYFYVEDLPPSLRMSSDLPREATTELELDAVAADIINKQDLTGKAMNPGLVALWTDERRRREAEGMTDPVTPPSSPPRDSGARGRSESEKFWYERLCQAIEEKKLSTEPRDYQDPDDPDATINMGRKLRPQVYPVETSQRDLQSLPDATLLEPHIESLNTTADLSLSDTHQRLYSDDTIVDEQLIQTQLQETDSISSQDNSDEELLHLLDDLAHDANKEEEKKGEKEKDEKEEEEKEIFKTPTSSRSQRPLSRGQESSTKKYPRSDDTIVDEQFILTQLQETDNIFSQDDSDEELLNLLDDLENKEEEEEEETDIFKTPTSSRSQRSLSRSQGSSSKKRPKSVPHEEEEELETLEMSQAIWSSDNNWADQDQTLMEDFARSTNCETEQTPCDIEDLFK